MLPKTLALIEDDRTFSEVLSQFLGEQGVQVSNFSDSNELLAHSAPYDYDFYIVDLMLPGIDGVHLIKVLRRRTDAGLIVVSARIDKDVFEQVMLAGADMYLAKPAGLKQVVMAIEAVHRRAARSSRLDNDWKLDRRAVQLVAPDGARIDLSAADVAVLECFVAANGETVSRDALRHQLGRDGGRVAADGLNATVYRLRRRVARATQQPFPLQSKSRVGYQFRAPLNPV